jgi:hypothetical protein
VFQLKTAFHIHLANLALLGDAHTNVKTLQSQTRDRDVNIHGLVSPTAELRMRYSREDQLKLLLVFMKISSTMKAEFTTTLLEVSWEVTLSRLSDGELKKV